LWSLTYASHTSGNETCCDLALIEKSLIGLVYGATNQLACARRTGASAAKQRQIKVLIHRSLEDRVMLIAVDLRFRPCLALMSVTLQIAIEAGWEMGSNLF
jgi:hypothetical protein